MDDVTGFLSDVADAVFDRLADVGFAGLTGAEQVFVCVWSAQGEIDNGGLDQFYFNSSGDWALQTPDALRSIGTDDLADIMTRANGLFPGGPSRVEPERRTQLDALSESQEELLEDLGDDFSEKAYEKVDGLLFAFVQANREEFSARE